MQVSPLGPNFSGAGEYIRLEGENAVSRLLVEVMGKRLKSLGCEVDRRFLAEALRRVSNGPLGPEKLGGLVLSRGGQGDLVATTKDSWKVSLLYHGSDQGGEVAVFVRDPEAGQLGHGWWTQDLPDGGAARVTIFAHHHPADGGLGESAYVGRESHMFAGMLWDPSLTRPAEVAYYPDGNVYWWHRYQNGFGKGKSGSPLFANYWENGRMRALEFGSEHVGKSRPLADGPAYCEFHPNGRPAVEIFAERKWDESSGRSVLQSGWKARYFDVHGIQTTRKVMMEIKSEGEAFGNQARRDLEDQGENKREERLFIDHFTESISQHVSVIPRPFFISESEDLSYLAQTLAQAQSPSNTSLSKGRLSPLVYPSPAPPPSSPTL